VLELNAFFFNSIFHWMAAYDSFHIYSFREFLILFLFLVRCFSCICSLFTWVHPLVLIKFDCFKKSFLYFFYGNKKKRLYMVLRFAMSTISS
jgi:hypothetical protein